MNQSYLGNGAIVWALIATLAFIFLLASILLLRMKSYRRCRRCRSLHNGFGHRHLYLDQHVMTRMKDYPYQTCSECSRLRNK